MGISKSWVKGRKTSTEFSKLSGIESFEMEGGSNCIIVLNSVINGLKLPASKYAYYVYNGKKGFSYHRFSVETSCGVKNCVKKEHLIVEFIPNSEDIDNINEYLEEIGIDNMARALRIPIDLFNKYLKKEHEKEI